MSMNNLIEDSRKHILLQWMTIMGWNAPITVNSFNSSTDAMVTFAFISLTYLLYSSQSFCSCFPSQSLLMLRGLPLIYCEIYTLSCSYCSVKCTFALVMPLYRTKLSSQRGLIIMKYLSRPLKIVDLFFFKEALYLMDLWTKEKDANIFHLKSHAGRCNQYIEDRCHFTQSGIIWVFLPVCWHFFKNTTNICIWMNRGIFWALILLESIAGVRSTIKYIFMDFVTPVVFPTYEINILWHFPIRVLITLWKR